MNATARDIIIALAAHTDRELGHAALEEGSWVYQQLDDEARARAGKEGSTRLAGVHIRGRLLERAIGHHGQIADRMSIVGPPRSPIGR